MGMAMLASKPTMAKTTSNSIRVKPFFGIRFNDMMEASPYPNTKLLPT
jgi:hypothetical protein